MPRVIVLIYTVDTLDPGSSSVGLVRESVEKATGIPKDNLVIAATHTHSAPRAANLPMYVERLTDVAKEALADR